jgi:DNA-binding transcriptional LysR family regulator
MQVTQQWPDPVHLDEALIFVAVGKQLSFTKAAAELGRDATVLSRRLSTLEARLGVRLLERTTRKILFTEAGAALYSRLSSNLNAIAEAEAEASEKGGEPQGTLRLALPSTFGRMWIAPCLPDFIRKYPKLRIDTSFSNRFVDLVGEGFDAAVRIGALPDSGLIARKIATHRRLLCASPRYLDEHGAPERPEDLAAHTCLGFTGFASYPDWRMTRRSDGENFTVRPNYRMISDDAESLAEATAQGMGIMMCTDWLVGRQLAQGELVPLLSDWTLAAEGAVHTVTPSRHLLAGKTRAFVDWLSQRFVGVPPWRTWTGSRLDHEAERAKA